MSDDDDTPAADHLPTRRPLSSWGDQDRRTLVITVVGGLAANLATVLIVGATIALVHATQSRHLFGIVLAAILTSFVIGCGAIVYGSVLRGRARRRKARPELHLVGAMYVTMGWLVWVECLLFLTGVAAGVK